MESVGTMFDKFTTLSDAPFHPYLTNVIVRLTKTQFLSQRFRDICAEHLW
jgi:hypothetical protein